MSVAYRSAGSGPNDTIVIGPSPRWWGLVFVVPYLLTYSRAFMHLVAPLPALDGGGGFCGNASRNFPEYMTAQSWAGEVVVILFLLGVAGIVVALTTFALPKTIVFVDRSARVLRVKTKAREWGVAFGDRPTLVERDGAYMLHAGALAPILVAPRGASRQAIEHLRAALATLR